MTELQTRVDEAILSEIRSQNPTVLSTLRLLKAAFQIAEKTKRDGEGITDAECITIVQRQIRMRDESIEAFAKVGQMNQVTQEEMEKKILQSFLPQQLTRDEITVIVVKAVEAVGSSDKGKIMKLVMPQTKGKADGREVNFIVEALLGK